MFFLFAAAVACMYALRFALVRRILGAQVQLNFVLSTPYARFKRTIRDYESFLFREGSPDVLVALRKIAGSVVVIRHSEGVVYIVP
jgi:hypothetical protein